jgi:hypothetical protein
MIPYLLVVGMGWERRWIPMSDGLLVSFKRIRRSLPRAAHMVCIDVVGARYVHARPDDGIVCRLMVTRHGFPLSYE